MAKHSFIDKKSTLDLHSIKPLPGESHQDCVFRLVDKFITPYLFKPSVDLRIIVGKGLGSKNFINGKNSLRYYTELYLDGVGIEYKEGSYIDGQEGVIRVVW
jgi:hypothetical protein